MSRPIAAIVTVLALSGFIRADEPKETPPLSFCIRSDQIQESELAKRLKAAMKGEYDELVKINVKEIGVSFDRMVSITGLIRKLENKDDDHPPVAVLELKAEDDVQAVIKTLTLKESERVIEFRDFPNAKVYKSKGISFIISGKLIVPVDHEPKKWGDFIESVDAAFKNHPVIVAEAGKLKSQLLVKVGPQVMPFVEKMGLPPGTDDFTPLVKATGYTLKASVTNSITVDLTGTFESNEAASAAKDSVAKAIALLGLLQGTLKAERERDKNSAHDLTFMIKQLEEIQKNTKPVAEGKSLVVRTVLIVPPDADRAFAELAETVKVDRLHSTVQNQFKQIMIAVYSYADMHNEFPGNYFDNDGKAMLSWRVRILPFIEQDALYKEFKLDEPWDSAHNKKLIAKMPKVFAHPLVAKTESGQTHFRSFAMKKQGKTKTFFPSFSDEVRKASGILIDGSANTFAFVEAADPVIWTKPDDLIYDPDGTLPKLGAGFTDGFHAALADGSARFVKNTVPENMIRAYITANGMEKKHDLGP